ncbi:ATP-binding protein [Saccharothrix sp. Mg75]|uniref:ATP-binding protein n=1 Tax=Saccharothrix sp. Mg75 TaxID=3445357 RepID=UPI003EE93C77
MALEVTRIDGATVVRPSGLLDLTSYRAFRDDLLKCAAEGPTGVVVRLDDGFRCATPAFMSIFATVWLRLAEWPGVPVVLVGESTGYRQFLASSAAGRLVPAFTLLAAALASLDEPPERRRDEIQLPDTIVGALVARQFVREACERWRLGALVDSAVVVVTELVENAVRHAASAPVVRLEYRGGRLSVAVRDDSAEPVSKPDPGATPPGGVGLAIVDSLSRVWGCAPWPSGGKVVWAVLG